MSAGSSMRPGPNFAAGLVALAGTENGARRVRAASRHSPASPALAHMRRFIAGATAIGASVARHKRAQQIIRLAMRQAREEVGARRSDQHQLGPARELDVTHGRFRRVVPEISRAPAVRRRPERSAA